ncbi:hypothetical protein L1987_42723 [Smallanthus sonchifolius]|uniref:Uncharacterized protein n=1 Tax=Smallanthus sonchifolius TaxID=185202 RepID=A0ACB9GJJ0_9ASTR|nr:hypothetical protein L1987_42723 [Smallanthus sonchifolius]
MIFLPGLPFHAIDKTDAPSMLKRCSLFDQESYKDFTIAGSFNGIQLLVPNSCSQHDHMILYNPFSGNFNTVPDLPTASGTTYAYGFGYGTIFDVLKIVRLRNSLNGPHTCTVVVFFRFGVDFFVIRIVFSGLDVRDVVGEVSSGTDWVEQTRGCDLLDQTEK